MKKLVALLLLPLLALAGEINPKTTIKEVTVYLNGARVTTESNVSLPAGTSEVRLSGLSPVIDANSIQISGLQNVSLLSVNFAVNNVSKKPDTEKITDLSAQLAALQKQLAMLQNANKGLTQEETLINNNIKLKGDNQNLSMEQVQSFSKYYRDRIAAVQNEIYDNNVKITALNTQIAALTSEVNKIKTGNTEQRGEILLKVDAQVPSTLTLVAKYNVSGAGWFAMYDIKTMGIKQPLDVFYNAHVYQKTGEDWNNVKITLSTGDPSANSIKPDATPHYLNFVASQGYYNAAQNYNYKYNPTIKLISGKVLDENGMELPGATIMEEGTGNGTSTDMSGNYTLKITNGKNLTYSFVGYKSVTLPVYSQQMNVKMEADATQLQEVVVIGYGTTRNDDSYSAEPEPKKETYPDEEEPEITGTGDEKRKGLAHTTFKISKSYTIPSQEDVTVLAIDKFSVPAEYEYTAMPVLNENAFLTAKIKDWEKLDLLAGDASVYFEGSYAGKTYLDPNKTDEALVISLGADPNIIVTREEIINKKAKSFMGGTRILDKNYEISVKNNKPADIYLVLVDRVPVSQNKEIKVEDVKTGDAEVDKDKGLLTWKLNLKTKETTKKQLSYKVKYPRGRKINM